MFARTDGGGRRLVVGSGGDGVSCMKYQPGDQQLKGLAQQQPQPHGVWAANESAWYRSMAEMYGIS